jgi:small multidrug resistance family-3 protein
LTSPSLSTIQLANTDLIVDYFKVLLLFTATAIAEIVGCYLPYLWLKHDKSVWLLLPASFSLALFVWLLTLHPAAAARVYAAYGGVYVAVAVGWLWFVDGVSPSRWDIAGVVVMLTGATIIAFQPQNAA